VSGLLLGLFLGVDLFLFGVVPLDSIAITLLVVVGLVGGIALGLLGPLGRSPKALPAEPGAPASTSPS
jgi:hypothetical protein